jgi:hypothetical protein
MWTDPGNIYVLPLYGGYICYKKRNDSICFNFKNIYKIFLLKTFTVRYILSHFTFLFFRRVTFLIFFCKTFCSLRICHGMHYLGELSPAAPAAWSLTAT